MSATDGSEFLAEWAARQDRRHAGPNARNKAAILPILAAAGIKTVTVTFDGYGDEGAIESVEALDGSDEPTVLPDVELEASIASWADNDPETLKRGPLEAVIRELALGCLAQKVRRLGGRARRAWRPRHRCGRRYDDASLQHALCRIHGPYRHLLGRRGRRAPSASPAHQAMMARLQVQCP